MTAALSAAPDAETRRVHVACSGGADSVALLGLLGLLARTDRLRLSVGHVDHGLRAESADEAAMVGELARAQGWSFAVTRLELAPGAGLPARAREARREALRAQARDHGAQWIALGHTATDQAETILMHLTRGASLLGLAGMVSHEWGDEGGWVRPLLDLERERARATAERLGLPFVDDPTNEDRRHPRVRVRHEVLEVLRLLNPKVESALARAATHAREAEEALGAWVEEELERRRVDPGTPSASGGAAAPGVAILEPVGPRSDGEAHAAAGCEGGGDVTSGARWSTEGMNQLPRAVRTRFVRQVCRAAGAPDDALRTTTLASIDTALLDPGPPRSWDLHPHLRLCVARSELWVETCATRALNH